MDIRNSLDGLRSLLGVNSPAVSAPQGKNSASTTTSIASDKATVSSVASEVSQSASSEGVRSEKVDAIKSALAAGTYHVPASALASKLVDSMLVSVQ